MNTVSDAQRPGVRSTLRTAAGVVLCALAIVTTTHAPVHPLAAPLAALLGATGLALGAGLARGWALPLRGGAVAALGIYLYARGASATVQPWQVPAGWTDLAAFSRAGAGFAAATLLCGLTLSLRGPFPPGWRQLLGWGRLPYGFNALLVLASPTLLATLGGWAGIAAGATHDAAVGRTLALGALTVLLVVAPGFGMDGRGLRGWRAWTTLGACIAAASLAPWIAALGSSPGLAAAPAVLAVPASLAAAALSQAALWAWAFAVTGVVLDALRHRRPTAQALAAHATKGARAGAKFGLVFMALMALLAGAADNAALVHAAAAAPVLCGALVGPLAFALAHAVIESSDASEAFFRRLRGHLGNPAALARGAVAGAALGLAAAQALPAADDGARALFGLAAGALTYAGVEWLRHALAIARRRRQGFEHLRAYAFQAAVGGFVGAALAWYFDRAQLAEVAARLLRFGTLNFAAAGEATHPMVIYPLFSKWGAIDLGTVAGGVQLLYAQSLAGLVNWALAAPLFSLNLFALNALLSGSSLPLRRVATREGLVEIVEQAVRVLRWGLWMAPIIFAFLKVAPAPTWYNQDGAIRSALATWQSVALGPEAYAAWSRDVFLGLLAYDWLRCLIWFDHMGLRVATLVNFSFVGLDWLERRWSRALGYGTGARLIPEALRRFCTWAPLLIPFYLPRGADWDYAWSGAERLQSSAAPLLPAVGDVLAAYLVAGACVVLAFAAWRRFAPDDGTRVPASPPGLALPCRVGNGLVTCEFAPDGRGVLSALRANGQAIDLTRRPRHPADGRGPWLYLRDPADGSLTRLDGFAAARERADAITLRWSRGTLAVEILLVADAREALLHWHVRIANAGPARALELLTLRELALGAPDAVERTPAFNALHVGSEFVPAAQALLAHNRLLAPRAGDAHEVAVHALLTRAPDVRLLGYQDARSHCFTEAAAARAADAGFRGGAEAGLAYTFEPVASLRIDCALPAGGECAVHLVDGWCANRADALALLGADPALPVAAGRALRAGVVGAHGFTADGTEFHAGPVTPRPWTHVLANAAGYGAIFSNLGDHCAFAYNAQQCMLTPFTLESVAPAAPGRAIYACELAGGRVDSAGHAPCRHADTDYATHFGLGYVVQRSSGPALALEATHFVVDDAPLEIALVRLTNREAVPRRYRVVPYAEWLLAEVRQGSHGLLELDRTSLPRTLVCRNPHNGWAPGFAFMATLDTPRAWELVGARFMGPARDLAAPAFVRDGAGAADVADDGYRVAACALEFEVPAGGSVETAVLFGFAGTLERVAALVDAVGSLDSARAAFERTRAAWRERLGVLRIESGDAGFDALVNHWLPYQALTARLWGRLGPEQRSGAFGFRDQLQDVLPFTLLDPALARRQLLLHASKQFGEGDVLKWWHPAPEGETSLGARTRASDPHLWLPYLALEYVRATGDAAVLDATAPFIDGPPVPHGEEGLGFVPRRADDRASLFEHCRRALEHSLARRGPRGLPLMGTGDWNDGFDALGVAGRGESGWLALFLAGTLEGWATLAAARGRAEDARRWRAAAGELGAALARTRRGPHYLRATDDAGRELAVTDALMGAWPALSGVVPLEDAAAAFDAALAALEQEDLVCIMQPAQDAASTPWPGRVATYPPGVRENGGQYSHGVSWLVDAACALAEGFGAGGDAARAAHYRDAAARLWRKISPLHHAAPARLPTYGQPPHQQTADIYFGPGYAGRGGWTAYTGAASRMLWAAWRLAGLECENGAPRLRALPPGGWPGVIAVDYRGRRLGPDPLARANAEQADV